MPKVSIILPVYNGEEYIKDCITSIKHQTFSDFECILVDDGSTDNTLKISEEIIDNDPKFKIISTKHHSLSDARNTGINNVSSPIVMYIDADDTAYPNMMEEVVSFMDTHQLDMMFFDAEAVNIDLSKFKYSGEKHYFERRQDYGISSGRDMLRTIINNRDFTYAVFIYASKLESIKYRYFPKMRAQDQLYTIENLYLANKVGHLHKTLYAKTCRKASVTFSKHDVHFVWSRVQTARELVAYMEHEDIPDIYKEDIFIYMINRIANQMKFMKKYVLEKDMKWIKSLPYIKKK